MLPPLGAALSASVDYQTATRSLIRPPASGAPGDGTGTATLPPNLLSGGRVDILSLSTQLNLAQGLSAFADTIGSLLKISRREGESLLDYAHRLSDALKSLSPSQRALLEQNLTQLLRGVTLRVLIDVLNNPLGPEAARLSAQLEMAQVKDRDLAARAVVTSYRQNDGSEAALTPTPTSRPDVVASPAGPTRQPSPTSPTTSPNPASAPATAPKAGASTVPARVSIDVPSLAPDFESEAPGNSTATRSVAASTVTGSPPTMGREAAAGSNMLFNSSPSAEVDLPEILHGAAKAGQAEPQAPTVAQANGKAAAGEALAHASAAALALTPDAPLLARAAQRVLEGAKNAFLQQVLFQSGNTGSASPQAPIQTAAGNTPLSPSPQAGSVQSGTEASVTTSRFDMPQPLPSSPSSAAAGTTETSELQPLPQPAVVKVAAAPAQVLPDPAAFVAAAPMIAREGLAQAFVTYPPAPQPPREEERDVERVSAIDEDGGGRSSHQDAQGDNQSAEDDHPSGDGEDDAVGGSNDGRADHAQDLYFRMADLT
ncbi:hypothetical protein ABID21_000740 [Pseudorhizobium tarimense]|uniref:Uncharacterized protein n=1 Tax=Pseudorhizobium tarimense TaxID=1079109 RepID=A0ABV2H282_9HYPH|nr:hypothetical protein [Pseudorhizobium tarimense]MCJ8517747.1 hypothetical protein [Pseudorhizobium tarimense]